jgi:hypothetical protein
MNFIKTAALKLNKEEIQGKYGKFMAYLVEGDTMPIKDRLKSIGFQWYGPKKVWWMSDKKMTPYIKSQLEALGISSNNQPVQENTGNINQPAKPTYTPQPPPPKPEETDDPEMSAWYGFPIKKNIYSFTTPVTIEDKEYEVKVYVSRSFQKGATSTSYKTTKSREHRFLPKYIIGMEIPEIEYKNSFKQQSKEKWGQYNEQTVLEGIKKLVEDALSVPKTKVRAGIEFLHDVSLRDDNYKQFLEDLGDKKIPAPEYDFTINDPEYGGNYKVKIYELGMDKKSPSTTIGALIDSPLAPKYLKSFGYQNIDLSKTRTIDDFHRKIQQFISDKKDYIQEEFLKYLKSFPFLDSQKAEASSDFNVVLDYIKNRTADTDSILRKLQEKGYIRPSKRQKQSPGMTMGDEIKWVIDSPKIVDDAYGSSYVQNTPDYFYSVVAYYVHRRIRNISSFTDMMLVDVISKWIDTMKKMGATITFREVDLSISQIGDAIARKIQGHTTKEETVNPTNTDSALNEFAQFVQKYEIDAENIQNNAKGIYRMLAQQIHPDKFPDPATKLQKEEEFKELQAIWSRVPSQYKTAFNWYQLCIYSSRGKFI